MRFGRYIGYARAETKGDLDKLDDWGEQLQQLGVSDVFTDVGPLETEQSNLKQAIGSMKINDVLVFPETCLQGLAIGNVLTLFSNIPHGGELMFFEVADANYFKIPDDFTTIRLGAGTCATIS
ncbi:hypothetical protein [Sulfitobacter geojensis]|uniref:hypothetical protein n=1 Tax=Sulfitobacter geojensis TaxID=1342299 RepID=UPI003B8E1BAF